MAVWVFHIWFQDIKSLGRYIIHFPTFGDSTLVSLFAATKNLKQWDVVIADRIYQHDFDARTLFDEFMIPASGVQDSADSNITVPFYFRNITKL